MDHCKTAVKTSAPDPAGDPTAATFPYKTAARMHIFRKQAKMHLFYSKNGHRVFGTTPFSAARVRFLKKNAKKAHVL